MEKINDINKRFENLRQQALKEKDKKKKEKIINKMEEFKKYSCKDIEEFAKTIDETEQMEKVINEVEKEKEISNIEKMISYLCKMNVRTNKAQVVLQYDAGIKVLERLIYALKHPNNEVKTK